MSLNRINLLGDFCIAGINLFLDHNFAVKEHKILAVYD